MDRSKLTVAAGAASLVLVGIVAASRRHAPVPEAVTVAAAVAFGLALAASARAVASAWRGPELRQFPHDEAVCCSPAQADVVRAAAQLRGTLGGAGYVHRGRVALGALGWIAAAAFALDVQLGAPLAVLLLLAGAAFALGIASGVFPARAFYYREAMGGRVVVHPRTAFEELARLRPQLLGEASFSAAEAPGAPAVEPGWGTTLNVSSNGAKDAASRVRAPS